MASAYKRLPAGGATRILLRTGSDLLQRHAEVVRVNAVYYPVVSGDMQVNNFFADQDAVVQHGLFERAADMNARREVHRRDDILYHGEVCRRGIGVD